MSNSGKTLDGPSNTTPSTDQNPEKKSNRLPQEVVEISKLREEMRNTEEKESQKQTKEKLKGLDEHRKRKEELQKRYRKGKLKEECKKKYDIVLGENATVMNALAALAQAKKPGFESWDALTYQNNTADVLHGPMHSVYTLLADSDFSGDVVDMPDVSDARYKNRFLSFGRGIRRLAKDQTSADRTDLIAPSQLMGYLSDALASIKMQKGCDDATAQNTLCTHIASIIGLQDATTPETLFNAIKKTPNALCTFYDTIALAGPDMRTMLVLGKEKGLAAIQKERTQSLEQQNKIDAQELQKKEGEKEIKETIQEQIIVAPEVTQQLQTEAQKQALACVKAYIEHFQNLIKSAPTPEDKKAIHAVMMEQVKDQSALYNNLHRHLMTLYVGHVKDVVTTAGVGKTITLATITEKFGKEGIAERTKKISFSFGGGLNTYHKALSVLNKDTAGRLVGQIGISYGDEKAIGKRTSIFRGIGAGGAVFAGGTQRAGGANLGLSVALNQIDTDDAKEVWHIGGKTITKAQAIVGASRSTQGVARGPSLGFQNKKDEAIAQAKSVVFGEMANLLTKDDIAGEITKYTEGMDKKDTRAFNALMQKLTPILSEIKKTPKEQRTEVAIFWADRLATVRERMAHESLVGKVSVQGLNIGQILMTGGSPIGLLLIAASSFEQTKTPISTVDQAVRVAQAAQLESGVGAESLDLKSQVAVDGINDLLDLPKPGTDAKLSALHKIQEFKETVAGIDFTDSVETISFPKSLLDGKGQNAFLADDLARKYMTSDGNSFTVPKEMVHIQVFHDQEQGRKVAVSLGFAPNVSNLYTALDGNNIPNNPTALQDYKNELTKLQGIDAVKVAVTQTIDTNDDKKNSVNELFTQEGVTFVRDKNDAIEIKQVNGVWSFFVEIPADLTVEGQSTNGSTYKALPIDGTYTLTIDPTTTPPTKNLTRKIPNPEGLLQFIYDKKTKESNTTFFDVALGKIDDDIYEIMTDHDLLMNAKYYNNGYGTKKTEFLDLRNAIDQNKIKDATTAIKKLFPTKPFPDPLTWDHIRALDTSLCLISWTKDKSFETKDIEKRRGNELLNGVRFAGDNKQKVQGLLEKMSNDEAFNDSDLTIFNDFVQGKLTTKKPATGQTFLSGIRSSKEYQLAWMLAPLSKVELERRPRTTDAIGNSMKGVNVPDYLNVRDELLNRPQAKQSLMSDFPPPAIIEQYTNPNTSKPEIDTIEKQYPGVYIAKNGIGMVFGYKGLGKNVKIEPKFVTHPVMVKGLTQVMNDSQAKTRKDRYIKQMETIGSATLLLEEYHQSVLNQLPAEFKNILPMEEFKNALINGKKLEINGKTITIDPKRSEGFFVQCFNPTILLEGVVTTVTEKKDDHKGNVPAVKCNTQPVNTLNIAGTAMQSHRRSGSISSGVSLATLKASKPEIINVITDSKVKKALEEAKNTLTGDGKLFTHESEVYKIRASFSPEQIKEIANYLRTQYGADRDRTPAGKAGFQIVIWAYKSWGLVDADNFIKQLWNPVTIQQLTILRYDLLKIPYAQIQQRLALIYKQFDYKKPMDQQNSAVQEIAKETPDLKNPEKQPTIE